MSGWMIGLGLAGVFAGAVVGAVKEMAHDWNGGTTKPGALKRFFGSLVMGGALGVGVGYLFTDSKSPEEIVISECHKNVPEGQTVHVISGPDGVSCTYK